MNIREWQLIGFGVILFVAGCESPKDTLGTTIYTRKQTMFASIDARGEHLRGSDRITGYSPWGTWYIDSSSNDTFYTVQTGFHDTDGDHWLTSQDGREDRE